MNTRIVDTLAIVLALVIPIFAVWRFRRWGIIVGALSMWIILSAVGPVLSWLDPTRDAAIGDSLWNMGGWIVGLAYASLAYGVIVVIHKSRGRTMPS